MGSHDPFGHMQHKLWQKKRHGVKLAICLPTTESEESTQFPCVQVAYDTPLESSQRGLQLQFKPHPDRRPAQEVIVLQGCEILSFVDFETLDFVDFGTPIWESRDKKAFGYHSCGEVQSILYGGRWWLPPSPGRGEFCESKVARGSS
jgi:hypothetical protein